jgi:hypothetical protein
VGGVTGWASAAATETPRIIRIKKIARLDEKILLDFIQYY